MGDIYCGNNFLNRRLTNGELSLGNRSDCFRKGVGKGLNMDYDPSFKGPFEPIVDDKYYCGNSNNLPEGYNSFGSLSNCLQKGVGVGKRMKAISYTGKEKYMYLSLYLGLSLILFLVLYYLKPKYILTKEKKIDWKKFQLYYLSINILLVSLSAIVTIYI